MFGDFTSSNTCFFINNGQAKLLHFNQVVPCHKLVSTTIAIIPVLNYLKFNNGLTRGS